MCDVEYLCKQGRQGAVVSCHNCLQEEKLVRKKLQAKYMLLETRKDGTKFTNRPMKEAAERLQNLAGQYDDMQKQLVEQVITSVATSMSYDCC